MDKDREKEISWTQWLSETLFRADLITQEENHFIQEHTEEIMTNAKATTGFDFIFDGSQNHMVANVYYKAPKDHSMNEDENIYDTFGADQKEIINKKIEGLRQAIREESDQPDPVKKIKIMALLKWRFANNIDSSAAVRDLMKEQSEDVEYIGEKPDHWDKSKIYVLFGNYFT